MCMTVSLIGGSGRNCATLSRKSHALGAAVAGFFAAVNPGSENIAAFPAGQCYEEDGVII
jgi:hypothetical protein